MKRFQELATRLGNQLGCRAVLDGEIVALDDEGRIAKRKADSYQVETAWYKIKNPAYTQAEGRRGLFERG